MTEIERRSGLDRREGGSAEAELERVIGELHDEALQLLMTARQDIQAARDGEEEALPYAERAVGDAIAHLRRLVAEDSASQRLPVGGLTESAELLAEELSRHTTMQIEIDIEPAAKGLAEEALLFRLIREFVLNAAKHADAATVTASIQVKPHAIVVTVRDDGTGFDIDKPAKDGHVGLALSRRRVARANGTLTIRSDQTGGGTCITATLPRSTPE